MLPTYVVTALMNDGRRCIWIILNDTGKWKVAIEWVENIKQQIHYRTNLRKIIHKTVLIMDGFIHLVMVICVCISHGKDHFITFQEF